MAHLIGLLLAFWISNMVPSASQAQSVASACQEAAGVKPPDRVLAEISDGEEMVSALLSDLDHANPVFRCAVARWSDPAEGNPTIIVVVNSDSQLTLCQTKISVEAIATGKTVTSLPEDIGPASIGVFLFAGDINAVQLTTTVNGAEYISTSRTLPSGQCKIKRMDYAIKKLMFLTTDETAKFHVLSQFGRPSVLTVGIFFEKQNLGQNGEFTMEWAPERSDGIGCLQ